MKQCITKSQIDELTSKQKQMLKNLVIEKYNIDFKITKEGIANRVNIGFLMEEVSNDKQSNLTENNSKRILNDLVIENNWDFNNEMYTGFGDIWSVSLNKEDKIVDSIVYEESNLVATSSEFIDALWELFKLLNLKEES